MVPKRVVRQVVPWAVPWAALQAGNWVVQVPKAGQRVVPHPAGKPVGPPALSRQEGLVEPVARQVVALRV